MSDEKMTKQRVEALYAEKVELEKWLDPKPDPSMWPPVGWHPHPTSPGHYYRVLTEDDLREEIFGSERKRDWMQWASNRIAEINDLISPYFFAKPKEEGTGRKTKSGFVACLKTGLSRKFDLPVLATVMKLCQDIATKEKLAINVEQKVVKWEPKLDLKAFRELPPKIRKQLEQALVIEPTKPVFTIVRVEDAGDNEESEA